MRIFAEVPWRGSVKQQWVIENGDFQGFRTLRLWHLRRCAEADRDPQNIWDPRKDRGSFVDATFSEP